ncbi:hypothetical protein NKH86_30975 [Mesorhizobium sp. M0913]|uniref:hypothetical protein n=1 Tax=Mesorhizobium sp. M0913 TaxID=2957026 RepID=UPI0033388CF5
MFFLIYWRAGPGVVTTLWELYLLGLTFNRSAFPASPLHLARGDHPLAHSAEAYTRCWCPTSPFSPKCFTVAEIAIGLLCTYLLRHDVGAEASMPNPKLERPPLVVSLVAALLGIIRGTAIGAYAGFFAGSLIADATHMSCSRAAADSSPPSSASRPDRRRDLRHVAGQPAQQAPSS